MRTMQENRITWAVRQILLAVHDLCELANLPHPVDRGALNGTEESIREWFRDFIDQAHEIQDREIGSHADLYSYIDLDL